MKSIPLAALVLMASTPAFATSHVVVLSPADGKLIRGHAGLQAVDQETSQVKVRVITSGLSFHNRGTVRVLVLNHGSRPFNFGPEQVQLKLADGTELQPVSLNEFEKSAENAITAMNRQAATDMQVRNSLSTIAGTTDAQSSAQASQPMSGVSTPTASSNLAGLTGKSDDSYNNGAKTLDDIGEILMPERVDPGKASGGYVVFNLPKSLADADLDVPMTILVTAGGEVHRFDALIRHK
jgi:hypothetical protein